MLKSGEFHYIKCIICSTMKGNDMILGPKYDILAKHARKTKQIETCHIWVRNKKNYMSTEYVVM
jgi:hypothetical protein